MNTQNTIEYRGRRVTIDEYVTARAAESGQSDKQSLDDYAQDWGDLWAAEGEAGHGGDWQPSILVFGLEADQLTQPFCACGRVVSNCDGSRRGCGR